MPHFTFGGRRICDLTASLSRLLGQRACSEKSRERFRSTRVTSPKRGPGHQYGTAFSVCGCRLLHLEKITSWFIFWWKPTHVGLAWMRLPHTDVDGTEDNVKYEFKDP
jgi:hypothetical protein